MAAHSNTGTYQSPPHWRVLNQSAVKQTRLRKRQVKKFKQIKISVEWQNND